MRVTSIVLIGGLFAASAAASGCAWDTGGHGSRGHTGTGTPGAGTTTPAPEGGTAPGTTPKPGEGTKPGGPTTPAPGSSTPGGSGTKPGGNAPSGAGTTPGGGTPSGTETTPGGTPGGTETTPGGTMPVGGGTTPGGATSGTWTGSGTWTTNPGTTPGAGNTAGTRTIRKRINPFAAAVEPAECDETAGQSSGAKATPEGANARRYEPTLRGLEPSVEIDKEEVVCEDEASQSAGPDGIRAQRADQDPCMMLDPCADQDLMTRP